MSNHPNLLNALNELHIVIETISIPILVVGRPKKLLHFLFCKLLTYLPAFKARPSDASVINKCKLLTNDASFMIKNDIRSFPYNGFTYGNVTLSIFILTPSIFTLCLISLLPKLQMFLDMMMK